MAWATPTFGGKQRKSERDAARGTNKQRGYDEHWAQISRMVRSERPICEVCRNAPATEVDHIVPFAGMADPLRTQWSNLQSICRNCHNQKTHGRNNGRK